MPSARTTRPISPSAAMLSSLQIPSAIMQGLAYFPCDFFCEWIAGQDSVACQTIPNTVQGISSASLHELLEQLRACAIDSSSCGWASLVRCGLHVDRFLMLLHVLLRSTDCTVRYTAALIMLAALRCKGALHHGVLHPMCFIQLVNTLGEFLASSAIQFSVPMDCLLYTSPSPRD